MPALGSSRRTPRRFRSLAASACLSPVSDSIPNTLSPFRRRPKPRPTHHERQPVFQGTTGLEIPRGFKRRLTARAMSNQPAIFRAALRSAFSKASANCSSSRSVRRSSRPTLRHPATARSTSHKIAFTIAPRLMPSARRSSRRISDFRGSGAAVFLIGQVHAG